MGEFWDYVEFIYLNTLLTREEARGICVDAFNHGVDKHKLLEQILKGE